MFQKAARNGAALVVVGNHGLVLRSTDEGATWVRQELDGWPSLIDLAACPDGRLAALAAEGQVLVSTDDGQTWAAHPIPTEESPQGITCDPGQPPVGGRQLLDHHRQRRRWREPGTTSRSATTPSSRPSSSSTSRTPSYSANSAPTCAEPDGGETWTSGSRCRMSSIPRTPFSLIVSTGWVAGLAGQIQHTVDGGATWSLEQTPTLAPIYSLRSRRRGHLRGGRRRRAAQARRRPVARASSTASRSGCCCGLRSPSATTGC